MNEENKKEIADLKKRIKDLEDLPYRCCICGKPTDGYVRMLFFIVRYYCKAHFPYHQITY